MPGDRGPPLFQQSRASTTGSKEPNLLSSEQLLLLCAFSTQSFPSSPPYNQATKCHCAEDLPYEILYKLILHLYFPWIYLLYILSPYENTVPSMLYGLQIYLLPKIKTPTSKPRGIRTAKLNIIHPRLISSLENAFVGECQLIWSWLYFNLQKVTGFNSYTLANVSWLIINIHICFTTQTSWWGLYRVRMRNLTKTSDSSS